MESIFYPAAHSILGSWYKPSELAKRACIFHATSAAAAMFSGYLQAGVYKGLNGVQVHNRWLDDAEIGSFMANSDFAVLPYVEASQSGVAPLAFGRGRTVIATPVGGLPEQIRNGETGILTETVSAAALADAIRHLTEDRDLTHRLGRNALRHAETEISWSPFPTKVGAPVGTRLHRPLVTS